MNETITTRSVLGILGMPGSGKSMVAHFLRQLGLPVMRLGGFIEAEVGSRGLPPGAASEAIIRKALREEEGNDVLAKRALAAISSDETRRVFILDGVYSPEEDGLLRQRLGDAYFTMAIICDRHLRYQRLAIRDRRQLTSDEAIERDLHELAILRKADTIALADYFVVNNETRVDCLRSCLTRIAEHLDASGFLPGSAAIAKKRTTELLEALIEKRVDNAAMAWILMARALLDEDPLLTWHVVELVGRLQVKESVPFLVSIGLQRDAELENTTLHRMAARSLAKVDAGAREILPLLSSAEGETRAFAVDALGEIGDIGGLHPLLDRLRDDIDRNVMLWAALSIVKIAQRSGQVPIAAYVADLVPTLTGDRQLIAFDALMKIDAKLATKVLEKIEASDGDLNRVRGMREHLDLA